MSLPIDCHTADNMTLPINSSDISFYFTTHASKYFKVKLYPYLVLFSMLKYITYHAEAS